MTKEEFNIEEFKKGNTTITVKIPRTFTQIIHLQYDPEEPNLPIIMNKETEVGRQSYIGHYPLYELTHALEAEGAKITILDQEA